MPTDHTASAEIDGMVRALFADPNAVVTEQQVRAVAEQHTRAILAALHGAADAIERRRNEHWQRHLREHPYATGSSCPGDYAAHDAYHDAAKIVRGFMVISPGGPSDDR